jgi:ADP-heptose:LPS heptosyltransferase
VSRRRAVLAAVAPVPADPVLVVLRALWLGDLLTVVPCLRALADAFPEHRRVLATPAVLTPLVELADAGFEVVDAAPLAALPATCQDASVAVNLHGRGPESHHLLLATRPGRLIAFRRADVPATAASPSWGHHEHEVERWCRLLAESGIRADPGRLRLRRPNPPPREHAGATIVHAGAKAVERRWPAERWAAVARAEVAAGRPVLLTGSPAERPLALRVAALAGLHEADVPAGRTSLAELTAMVAHAGRLVSADTGVAHLATALGTPSVTLFGPTAPAEWGPLIDRHMHRVIWKGPARRGPEGRPHPALLHVGQEEVLTAVAQLPG